MFKIYDKQAIKTIFRLFSRDYNTLDDKRELFKCAVKTIQGYLP